MQSPCLISPHNLFPCSLFSVAEVGEGNQRLGGGLAVGLGYPSILVKVQMLDLALVKGDTTGCNLKENMKNNMPSEKTSTQR